MSFREIVEQRVKNCLVAQALMQDIPSSALTRGLGVWGNHVLFEDGPNACGAAACFGGWVARAPYFKRQGVRLYRWEGIATPTSDRSSAASYELFGRWDIFAGRRLPGEPRDEKAVIELRLREALECNLRDLEALDAAGA